MARSIPPLCLSGSEIYYQFVRYAPIIAAPVALHADDVVDKQSAINAAKSAFLQSGAASVGDGEIGVGTDNSDFIPRWRQGGSNWNTASCSAGHSLLGNEEVVAKDDSLRISND